MFECQICGLLSLGGTACPACGSQLRKDLSAENADGEVLPTEVPGLDDAAAAWYDLEGIEPPTEEEEPVAEAPANNTGTLPFGYQGASTVYAPSLPFGIGSFADGIPFDAGGGGAMMEATPSHPDEAEDLPGPTPAPEVAPIPIVEVETPSAPILPSEGVEEDAIDVLEVPSLPDLPMPAEVGDPASPPESTAVNNAPPPPSASEMSEAPVRLTSARLLTPAPVQEEPPVPDYWKIDAQIPDYEEIYGQEPAVVEMEYASLDDDVVVYDHTQDSPAAVFHTPLEATPQTPAKRSVKLQLHPAQALSVNVGQSAELQTMLNEGFQAMQRNDWSSAARSFQRMAAALPSNAEVYNNYGIALLQRATAMRDGGDPQQEVVAETQFESSILALREAAKNAPTNGDVLVNLAIALIESGRAEKALGIMNVHNARTPGSEKGLNTAGVAMFNLGQLTQAVETFGRAGGDAIVSGNLAQLSPNVA
ncbi:MAG: hypothetical protein DWC05_05725 [Candidatus Poseidoniales archaeon]|nr:MAG: hypothetical protein DWC05_05725 [Candidatus Poseidoniales archaeon]